MADSEYLFDNEAVETGDRFGALASLFDHVTFGHLDRLGVTEGWRCLEVGAGGGSVASWLATRVGPSGHVLATDLDVRWLEAQPHAPNVDVRRHDVVVDPLPEQSFDLVHERLVLVHVPERVAALGRLVSALRPGGWLVAEDFDSEIASDDFVAPESDEPIPAEKMSEDEELGNTIMHGVRSLLARHGADTALGHKLPRLLRAAGLEAVRADAYQVIEAGDAVRRLRRANLTQVADELVEQGIVSRADVQRHLTALDEGRVSPRSPLLVSAWGRRPLIGHDGSSMKDEAPT